MSRRYVISALFLAVFFLSGIPVSATDSYSYSIMHLSDTQFLSESYPDTLNYTFSYVESLKNTCNISAIIITGDLVNQGDNVSQWTRYVTAKSLTDIPVYEIPGNHDLKGTTDSSLFDEFVGNKSRWNSVINDFVFIGIGYSNKPLSDSERA
jgi:predicted MPP superfamily phosphohydrolase